MSLLGPRRRPSGVLSPSPGALLERGVGPAASALRARSGSAGGPRRPRPHPRRGGRAPGMFSGPGLRTLSHKPPYPSLASLLPASADSVSPTHPSTHPRPCGPFPAPLPPAPPPPGLQRLASQQRLPPGARPRLRARAPTLPCYCEGVDPGHSPPPRTFGAISGSPPSTVAHPDLLWALQPPAPLPALAQTVVTVLVGVPQSTGSSHLGPHARPHPLTVTCTHFQPGPLTPPPPSTAPLALGSVYCPV